MKTRNRSRRLAGSLAAASLLLITGNVSSADFPAKRVTLVIASTPGGALDGMVRIFTDRLATNLGKPVVVENRGGAIGSIAAGLVARAQPDGHTLLATSNSAIAIAAHVIKSLPYDPFSDLTPVTQIGEVPFVLVARPDLGVTTLEEFVNAARTKPGEIAYASGGDASDHHLAMEQFLAGTGIRLRHIPYKSGPLGFADLLGGHVATMFIAPGTALQQVRDRKLVALGVTTRGPLESYPGVPPIGKLVPGYEAVPWFAIFAPAGTPASIVAQLNREIGAAVLAPESRTRMKAMGVEARTSTPSELAVFARADYERQGKLIKALGLQAQ